MIDKKYLVLIHKKIDNSIAPEELTDLMSYLSVTPEAQRLLDELTKVSMMLKQVEGVEPPTHLKHDVMLQVRSIHETHPWRVSWFRRIFGVAEPRPAVKYTLCVAGGILVGFLLFAIMPETFVKRGQTELDKMRGSMVLGPEGNLEIAERKEIGLHGIRGEVVTRFGRGVVTAELSVNAPGAAEVRLQYDSLALVFTGFVQSSAHHQELSASRNEIRLLHHGTNQYIFTFDKTKSAESNLKIRLVSAEGLFEDSLSTGK